MLVRHRILEGQETIGEWVNIAGNSPLEPWAKPWAVNLLLNRLTLLCQVSCGMLYWHMALEDAIQRRKCPMGAPHTSSHYRLEYAPHCPGRIHLASLLKAMGSVDCNTCTAMQ